MMRPQSFRRADQDVVREFLKARRAADGPGPRLKLSWSNWGFGSEPLAEGAARLARNNVRHIELHGNLYGPDLGYRAPQVLALLADHGLRVSGVCGMVTPDQEFASIKPHVRQRAIDYFRRQIDFCREVGGSYLLFGAGAVGRPVRYDDNELRRAADTIRIIADHFAESGIRGAIEPIRPEETSVCHTFADAVRLLDMVDHPGVMHINGDLYHMLSGEEHIGRIILKYASRMVNLHLADTNRRALGRGLLDVDIVLMALYAAGYNRGDNYCSAEPLGPGANPYAAMNGRTDAKLLDDLVATTARTFYEREEELLNVDDDEISAAYQLADAS